MTLRSDWPDATDVHASFASTRALLAERRALYQFAAALYAPTARVTIDDLDNPVFRFRVGEALAGREPFDTAIDDSLGDLLTELPAGSARLALVSGAGAGERLARAMRLIHAQSGGAGEPPRLLTEADGESFREAAAVVEAGIAKVREVSPRLADDVLPHSRLLAVLDPATSNGLVSASSRLFPGLILIDKPGGEYDVAEALIHECAHQKFFDLAITRDFLGADVSGDDFFHPSWSSARWPVEQVIAAFHAYACLAQFAEDVTERGEAHLLGDNSLLCSARERELEIGCWMLNAESSLRHDARFFLRTFLGEPTTAAAPPENSAPCVDGEYELDPQVRSACMVDTRRVLLAGPGNPPSLLWLDREAAQLLDRLAVSSGATASDLEADEAVALANLVNYSLVRLAKTD